MFQAFPKGGSLNEDDCPDDLTPIPPLRLTWLVAFDQIACECRAVWSKPS